MPDSPYSSWFNTAGPQRSYSIQQASPRFAGMAWTQDVMGSNLPTALGTAGGQSDKEVKEQDKTFQSAGTPFDPIMGYFSGRGALTVGDETMPQPSTNWSDDANPKKFSSPVGQLSISPGGGFNLTSSRGWGVAGDPMTKSLGVTAPVNVAGNQGTVGLQGSFNQYNPYISGTFQFGRPAIAFGNQEEIDTGKTEVAVNNALGVNQTYDVDKKTYTEPYIRPEPSARERADRLIDEFRSSAGRDLNSPTTWRN
jgi:hypothetical protein